MGGAPIAVYLLDTHVFLWAVLSPEQLSGTTARLLESDAEFALSAISLWETVHLAQRGRIVLRSDPFQWIERALSASMPTLCPITAEIALESHRISLPHKDPADRFIAATAKVAGMTLVTADEFLLNCQDITVLPAR